MKSTDLVATTKHSVCSPPTGAGSRGVLVYKYAGAVFSEVGPPQVMVISHVYCAVELFLIHSRGRIFVVIRRHQEKCKDHRLPGRTELIFRDCLPKSL